MVLLVDEDRVYLSMELAKAVETTEAEGAVPVCCASDVKVRCPLTRPDLYPHP